MSDESNTNDSTVLRPFEAPEPEPLPPVEASKVVPEAVVDGTDPVDDWLPADLDLGDEPTGGLFRDFDGATTPPAEIDGRPVVTHAPTPEPAPPADPFAAVAAGLDGPTEVAGVPSVPEPPMPVVDDAAPVESPLVDERHDDVDIDESLDADDHDAVGFVPDIDAAMPAADLPTPDAIDDAARDATVVAAGLLADTATADAPDDPTDPEDRAGAAVAATVASATAGEWPSNPVGDDKIVLPRKGFLIGLGVAALLIAGLLALWQTSGGDNGETVTATGTSVPTENTDQSDVVDGDVADSDAPVVDDTASQELADAQAQVASLESEVEELAARPEPGIPGNRIRRIVVPADAKFVSAFEGSVAVLGAFGGLSIIDPETNQIIQTGQVAPAATRVLRTSSSIWITNYAGNEILQVDPVTATVLARFPFLGPDGIEKDGDTLIVASFDGNLVSRINPGSGEAIQTVDVGGSPTDVLSHPDHGLWVAVFSTGELVQIDRTTFEVIARVTVGQGPVGLAADATHIWVANHDDGTIAKIDPTTGELVEQIRVGDGPTELIANGGSVWVTATDEGSLVQVDVNNGSIITRTPLGGASAGGGPTGISFGGDAIWVAMQGEQSVVRVDL